MSFSITLFPIIAALAMADTTFLEDPAHKVVWATNNKLQTYFMEHCWQYHAVLDKFSNKELKSCASNDVTEVNAFLRANNFTIQLEAEPKETHPFFIASIMDVMVRWMQTGIKAQIIQTKNGGLCHTETILYPAITLKKHMKVYTVKKHKHPVCEIVTQNGDTVCMTIGDQPGQDFDLLGKVIALDEMVANFDSRQENYASITFPMISYHEKPDISWLKRMGKKGAFISQALQETKFQMNQHGAACQSAAAIGMLKSIQLAPPKHLIIDRPFYLWIKRPGIGLPIFAAYFDQSHWQEPAAGLESN